MAKLSNFSAFAKIGASRDVREICVNELCTVLHRTAN